MNTCPICDEPVKDVDRACQCGELLQPWRTIEFYGTTLRQQGLALASRGDYLGACLSFLEAALSNPLDTFCTLDVVRSLIHLERFNDAAVWLKAVGNQGNHEDAEKLATVISDRLKQRNADPESLEAGAENAVDLPEEASPPPSIKRRRPPLALPCIPRSRSILARVRRDKTAEAFWGLVVQAEKREGDWTALHGWADMVGDQDLAGGLFHYVQGLGDFQVGDDDAATQSFSRCLECDPPYMNPAAYLIFGCLGRADRARQLVQWMLKTHGQTDLKETVDCMTDRLHDRLDEAQARDLETLARLCR